MAKEKTAVGTVAWRDPTADDADGGRDSYAKVVGWKVEALDTGGYRDHCTVPPKGKASEAGVCRERGGNARIPSPWLMYVVVADFDASLAACEQNGGKQLTDVRASGEGTFAAIEDPAGAVLALYRYAEWSAHESPADSGRSLELRVGSPPLARADTDSNGRARGFPRPTRAASDTWLTW